MPELTTPLAAFSEIGEALITVFVGFTFVLVVLLILTGATTLIGKLAAKPPAAPPAEAPTRSAPVPASSAATRSATDEASIDPKVLAAIAAAIRYAVGKRPHRVLAIWASSAGWAQEGRRQIFSSHRLR